MKSPETETNTEDVSLMQEVAKGDERAFRRLVEKHQHPVVGTIAKMLGSGTDAEDLAQQVFIRVWKSAKSYQPKAKFTTWLFTITRNLVFSEIRKRSRKKTQSLDEMDEAYGPNLAAEGDPSEDLRHLELQKAVDKAISELPEKQRLAVVLRRYENLPYEEIADVLSLSVSAVKSQLFRARTTLRESLSRYLES